jgi:hypothetical protein
MATCFGSFDMRTAVSVFVCGLVLMVAGGAIGWTIRGGWVRGEFK